jgi:hypothetical protein
MAPSNPFGRDPFRSRDRQGLVVLLSRIVVVDADRELPVAVSYRCPDDIAGYSLKITGAAGETHTRCAY